MGLDCYLYSKLYMSKYQGDQKKAEKVRKIFPEMFKSGILDTLEIKFEVGYLRKANQIHKWFVDKCQDGVDDCGNYDVSREDLINLLDLCKKVLKNPEEASKLLPITEGFFFGGTEYDESYFLDLKETIKIIERCLKLPAEWDFEYNSSW